MASTTVMVRKATKQAVNRRKGAHLSTLRYIILLIAGYTLNIKAFSIRNSGFAVAIDNVVNGALIIVAEHIDVNSVGANKELIRNF